MSKLKIISLTASLVLAMVFTFSCSSDDDGGGGGGVQAEESSSSLGEDTPSSSSEDGVPLSSEAEQELSSSSVGGDTPSSSSEDGMPLSSSEAEQELSSSSAVPGGESSSSNGGNSSSSQSVNGHVFIDQRDGKAYKYEIALDGTVWMSENLNYSRDNTLGYCYGVDINEADPNQDASGCDNGYGRLYEWETAIDGNSPQGLCPLGWHIPSTTEWNSVIVNTNTWRMSLGFYIYPGNYNSSEFQNLVGWKERDKSGFYWTSSGVTYFTGFWDGPDSPNSSNNRPRFILEAQSGASSTDRFSVRCIKDSEFVPPPPSYGSETYGEQTYRTVRIGEQVWFGENLNYDVEGSVCFNNDPDNCTIYGRLYDWEMAMAVCPSGWHLPSRAEWNVMTDYVGKNEGKKLNATSGWNGNGNGIEWYGFSALPGGGFLYGSFGGVGSNGNWWSASESNSDNAYYKSSTSWDYDSPSYNKSALLSVRCLQN